MHQDMYSVCVDKATDLRLCARPGRDEGRAVMSLSKHKGFKSRASAQRFLETHAAVYNTVTIQQHLLSRGALCVLRARSESVWTRAVA